jgi:retron-type reverse transcriptase
MTIKRIQVKETTIIDAPFDGKLKDIIAQLQDWMNEGEWEGIESEYCQDYGDEYYLYKFREENDQEYEKRMKELEKQKAQELKTKEKRRKEYEKLKKEFGEDT